MPQLSKKATATWHTHGVAAVLEWPENAERVLHNLQGTTLVQKPGTHNWIHLPVTAAGWLNKRVEHVIGFGFRAACNETARIDRVRLFDSGEGRNNGGTPSFDEQINFLDEPVWFERELPEALNWYSGRVISIHVEFLSGPPDGRIEFRGGDIFTRSR